MTQVSLILVILAGGVPVNLGFETSKPVVNLLEGVSNVERDRAGESRRTEEPEGRSSGQRLRDESDAGGRGDSPEQSRRPEEPERWGGQLDRQIWMITNRETCGWCRKWEADEAPKLRERGWGISEKQEARHIRLIPENLTTVAVDALPTYILMTPQGEVARLEGYQDGFALLDLWNTPDAKQADRGSEAQVHSVPDRAAPAVSVGLFDWFPVKVQSRQSCGSCLVTH